MRLVGVEQEAESTGGEEDGKGDNFFGFYLLSLSLSRGDWEHFDVKRLRSSIRAFTDQSKKEDARLRKVAGSEELGSRNLYFASFGNVRRLSEGASKRRSEE